MNKTITIPVQIYELLRRESEKLQKLEAGGVDNWEWYGDCLGGWEPYEYKDGDEMETF